MQLNSPVYLRTVSSNDMREASISTPYLPVKGHDESLIGDCVRIRGRITTLDVQQDAQGERQDVAGTDHLLEVIVHDRGWKEVQRGGRGREHSKGHQCEEKASHTVILVTGTVVLGGNRAQKLRARHKLE